MGWGKRETRKKAESVRMTGREIQCSREPKHVPAEGAPRPSRGYHGPRRLCCAGLVRAQPRKRLPIAAGCPHGRPRLCRRPPLRAVPGGRREITLR